MPHDRDHSRELLDRARAMRRIPSEAEKALWYWLRKKSIGGLKFRRQAPLDGYIVDFLCSEVRLIVEVDGEQHNERMAYDERRQATLESHGFWFLRFSSLEVLKRPEWIAQTIELEIVERYRSVGRPPPQPSPASGGGSAEASRAMTTSRVSSDPHPSPPPRAGEGVRS